MKRILCILMVLIMSSGILCFGMAEEVESPYKHYLETGEYTGIKEYWADQVLIGCAISSNQLLGKKFTDLVVKNFNSITCENEMKADSILDRNGSVSQGDPLHAKLHFGGADKVMSFAMANGIKVRAHNLIWHSQTPRWFFAVDYSNKQDAPLVDRETMIARMENYIHDEMEHFNTRYPGVIYAWDVVNEAIEPAKCDENGLRTESLWYQVVGPDYIELAFTFARQYADPDQKLFYNDYNEFQTVKRNYIVKLINKLKEKGIIDGMGMQSHLGVTSPSLLDLMDSIRAYCEAGVTVHLTELDFTSEDPSVKGQMILAARYKIIFNMVKRMREEYGYDVENVTVWGVHDGSTWLTDKKRICYPLLFTREFEPKAAFFGAALDPMIPASQANPNIELALKNLNMQ